MLKEAEPFENEEILQLQAEILRIQEEIFATVRNHKDISELLQSQKECARELIAQIYPPKPRPTRVPYLKIIK
jgi:hypothetical protein